MTVSQKAIRCDLVKVPVSKMKNYGLKKAEKLVICKYTWKETAGGQQDNRLRAKPFTLQETAPRRG